MRIIIPGGTGLIGKSLSTTLQKKGHEVIILSRNPSRFQDPGSQIQVVRWDGKSSKGWGELVDGAGAIINLAGESVAGDSLLNIKWMDERKRGIRQSRVNAGIAVVEAVNLANKKPEVVIQASAVGFYGTQSQGKLDETAPAGDDFLAGVCREWEAATLDVEKMGVRRAVVRIGVVLSLLGGALPRQILPFKFFAGGPIGNGKQGYPWVHTDDVVAALIFLVENPQAQGIFNLNAPNPVTNAEFSRELGKVMKRPAFIPAPGLVFKLAFGEASVILLEGQMPIPAHLLSLGYKFQYPQVRPALENLFKV